LSLSILSDIHMTGPQVFDWVVSLANFGIMFLLFRLVVIIPMQEAVKLREQRVALRLKEIEQMAQDAEATRAEFEVRFGEVDKVLAEVKKTSERSLAQVQQRLQERAEAEERYVLDKAKAEAVSLKRDAENKVRAQVASSAVARAEALLIEALDSSAQNKVLTASVQRMGEL
jgi:F0F1-type ATP synthase membrane subunit b/b'